MVAISMSARTAAVADIPAILVDRLVLAEGLRPSDSPTRSLARRFAGALRSRGSLAAARSLTPGRLAEAPTARRRVAGRVDYEATSGILSKDRLWTRSSPIFATACACCASRRGFALVTIGDAGARHRCHDRDVQRGRRRAPQAVAGEGPGTPADRLDVQTRTGFNHWPLSYASYVGMRERLRTVSGVAAHPYAGALPAVVHLDDGSAMPLPAGSSHGRVVRRARRARPRGPVADGRRRPGRRTARRGAVERSRRAFVRQRGRRRRPSRAASGNHVHRRRRHAGGVRLSADRRSMGAGRVVARLALHGVGSGGARRAGVHHRTDASRI